MNQNEYLKTVNHGGHSMSDKPCGACVDVDACWWPARIQRAETFAFHHHSGMLYGERPYMFHLSTVVDLLKLHRAHPAIIAAGWLHDVVEDCDVSYFDVIEAIDEPLSFGVQVAKLVWSVTKNKGEGTPFSRFDKVPGSVMLKLADRIANVEACQRDMSKDDNLYRWRMKRYRCEQLRFMTYRIPGQFDALWERLERALK